MKAVLRLRDAAYHSLIRPSLEYSCSVWFLFKKIDGIKFEEIQRRVECFVTGKYKCLRYGTESREEQRLVLLTNFFQATISD